MGQERLEKLNQDNANKNGPPNREGVDMTCLINEYILNMNAEQKVIYCRFGEKFI